MPANSVPVPRASGIYGSFALDNRPLDPLHAQALGLPMPGGGASWAVTGHDPFAADAVSRLDDDGATTLIVGFIEDAGDLAQRLGLAHCATPAQIARAALARFGSDAPAHVIGEWSLLHRAADGTVTLMIAAGVRDPIFYALAGPRLAVAPNLFALARLDWVDRGIDEAGLLFPVARAHLRAARGDTTMLRSVRQLGSGASAVIDPAGGVILRRAAVLVEQSRLPHSFDEFVEAAEDLLRHIMETRLARTQRAAHMLSGGLDSSLLAWLSAEERVDEPGRAPFAVTSAAPPGSGLADETAFAGIVANTIGMACHPVWPDEHANAYRPKLAILTGQNGPPAGNRYGLTDALVTTALAQGASAMIDGTYGEMTATVRLPAPGLKPALRRRAAALYHSLRALGAPRTAPSTAASAFHARLAPHRLAALPDVMTAALAAPEPRYAMPGPADLLGYIPGIERGLGHANEFYPGMPRTELPFRDMRLLRLFAGIPVQTLLQGDADRGVARRMMEGHLPDSIRLRRRGMPASPSHNQRLRRDALAARARIALFRKAGVDDWLDIDWLDGALAAMAIAGPRDVTHGNDVQITAIIAEFLLWWHDQGCSTTP